MPLSWYFRQVAKGSNAARKKIQIKPSPAGICSMIQTSLLQCFSLPSVASIRAICIYYQVTYVNADTEQVKVFVGQPRSSFPITKTENQTVVNPRMN